MSNNKFKILIVEDEANILSFIKANLEISDYQVICAETCALGMMMYASYHPDLIVLDLGLPDRDGLSLIQDVREADTVPIIVLSARSGEMDKVEALDLGANDYITKPFSPSELVARVKAHLARYERLIGSSVETRNIIEIRGIKIDKDARRVWVNEEEKAFTSKEFDLLCFLAENPNRVYTKEELFKEIWDMESVGDIATVTVHIKKIREKIELDTSNPQYIETIWGVGYRFKV